MRLLGRRARRLVIRRMRNKLYYACCAVTKLKLLFKVCEHGLWLTRENHHFKLHNHNQTSTLPDRLLHS